MWIPNETKSLRILAERATRLRFWRAARVKSLGIKLNLHYKKRWEVEEYHRALIQDAFLAQSPTRTPTTQTNHFVAALWTFTNLELLKVRTNRNHYAPKTHLYLSVLQKAFQA